jgi:hypothetical protein
MKVCIHFLIHKQPPPSCEKVVITQEEATFTGCRIQKVLVCMWASKLPLRRLSYSACNCLCPMPQPCLHLWWIITCIQPISRQKNNKVLSSLMFVCLTLWLLGIWWHPRINPTWKILTNLLYKWETLQWNAPWIVTRISQDMLTKLVRLQIEQDGV